MGWVTEAPADVSSNTTGEINVKDVTYGAKGDGVTDDTTAFQNAFNAAAPGNTVIFPVGRYNITSTLTLKTNVIYRGESIGGQAPTDGTVLLHNAGTNPLFSLITAAAPADMTFRDFKIQQGSGTGDAVLLGTSVNQVTNCQFINIYFRGIGGGGSGTAWCINGVNILEVTIRDCEVTHCSKGFFIGSNANKIVDSNLSNNGDGTTAIQLAGSGNTIEGCVIEAWRPAVGNYAVEIGNVTVGGSSDNRVIDNWFEDNNARNCRISSTAGNWTTAVKIQGNHITDGAFTTTTYTLGTTWIDNSVLVTNIETSPDTNPCSHVFIANYNLNLTDNSTANRDIVVRLGNRGDIAGAMAITGPINNLIFDDTKGIFGKLGTQSFLGFNQKGAHSWSNVAGLALAVAQLVIGNQVGDMIFSNWDLKGWRWINNTQGASNAQVGYLDPSGTYTFAGHLIASSSGIPASSALGANVTSVTPSGNDTRGELTIVMAGALAANTRIATITFAATYGATAPKVILVDQTSAVGIGLVNFYVSAQSTGVSFDIASDQALGAGTYKVDYIVIG